MPAKIDYVERCKDRIQADAATIRLLEVQWSEATDYIKWDEVPCNLTRKVTCGCGQRKAIELMFRCYFCGIWFCANCAREHFGEENR